MLSAAGLHSCNWDQVLQITDCTAPIDRPLYLLVHNEQVQAADPEDKLYYSQVRSWDCRTIAQAKAFSTEGRALLTKVLYSKACLKQLLIASCS
jgi:hypothetical protein